MTRRSSKSKTPTIFKRLSTRLQRCLSRQIQQNNHDYKTQSEVFQGSMSYFIFIGRYLGLFPNTSSDHRQKYPLLSKRFTIPIMTCLSQLAIATFSLVGVVCTSLNVSTVSQLSYYGTSFVCSVLVVRLATKWDDIVNQIEVADLDEYIDPSVKFKCNLATIAFISFAFLHNILSVTSKLSAASESASHNITFFEHYIVTSHQWYFELGARVRGEHSAPAGLALIILNMAATIHLTYYQVFVICVSLYLQSVLEKINVKITSHCDYLSASHWRVLRHDYNRATRLVRAVDQLVNGLVFTLFASNLYFVCLEIFFILRNDDEIGLFQDYSQIATDTFKVYSTVCIISNFFTVSLIVSKVHSASLRVSPALYGVPSHAYCVEVQRFIDQVQGDPVALTGLSFFYVTKEVILTMVGTIATYELVLLQWSYN